LELRMGTGSSSNKKPATKPPSDVTTATKLVMDKSEIPTFRGFTPMPPLQNRPISVEIIGAEGTGKTRMASTFPLPAMCDTEFKGYEVWELFMSGCDVNGEPSPFYSKYAEDWAKNGRTPESTYYYQAFDWGDVSAFYQQVISDPNVRTIIFDSSTDLRAWAELWTLKEMGRGTLMSEKGAVMFNKAFEKLNHIIQHPRKKGLHLIFTTPLKDEYINDQKTGKMVPGGYSKAAYQFQYRILLRMGLPYKGKTIYPRRVFGEVLKNGYVKPNHSIPYLMDCTYDGLVQEIGKKEWDKDPSAYIEEVIIPHLRENEGLSPT